MPCCPCNASGKRVNCKCVKEGAKCLDCLPGRLGNCSNPVDSTTADESRNPETVPPELTPLNTAPLPTFVPHGAPNFVWGSMTGEQFCKKIDECYEEIVTWRRNIFKIPSGKQGQLFRCSHLYGMHCPQSCHGTTIPHPAKAITSVQSKGPCLLYPEEIAVVGRW